jgi:hypothetical protein
MSVNIMVPDSDLPNSLSEDDSLQPELGKNHPSIRAKSCRPSRLNNTDAPLRIFSITYKGNRGGV